MKICEDCPDAYDFHIFGSVRGSVGLSDTSSRTLIVKCFHALILLSCIHQNKSFNRYRLSQVSL